LYSNIHAKRKRIAAGSGEKMRKAGAKGAPSAKSFKAAAKTAKKKKKWEQENTDHLLSLSHARVAQRPANAQWQASV